VERERVANVTGRSRKQQIELTRLFGIDDYAQPVGGCCFLTDANYTRRLQDLWTSGTAKDYDFDDIMLLIVGRHLRLRAHFKLIARDEGKCQFLNDYRKRDPHIQCDSHPGINRIAPI